MPPMTSADPGRGGALPLKGHPRPEAQPAHPLKACSFSSDAPLSFSPSCFLAILAASGPMAASISTGSTSSNQMSCLKGEGQAERESWRHPHGIGPNAQRLLLFRPGDTHPFATFLLS